MNTEDMKAYVIAELPKMNDYSFMGDDFEKIVATLIRLEDDYIKSIIPNPDGDCDYDDEEAFNVIFHGIRREFPDYAMFFECMVDDYLEISEKFLTDAGEIDWQ